MRQGFMRELCMWIVLLGSSNAGLAQQVPDSTPPDSAPPATWPTGSPDPNQFVQPSDQCGPNQACLKPDNPPPTAQANAPCVNLNSTAQAMSKADTLFNALEGFTGEVPYVSTATDLTNLANSANNEGSSGLIKETIVTGVDNGTRIVVTGLCAPELGPLAPLAGTAAGKCAASLTKYALNQPPAPPSDASYACAKAGSCASGNDWQGNSTGTTAPGANTTAPSPSVSSQQGESNQPCTAPPKSNTADNPSPQPSPQPGPQPQGSNLSDSGPDEFDSQLAAQGASATTSFNNQMSTAVANNAGALNTASSVQDVSTQRNAAGTGSPGRAVANASVIPSILSALQRNSSARQMSSVGSGAYCTPTAVIDILNQCNTAVQGMGICEESRQIVACMTRAQVACGNCLSCINTARAQQLAAKNTATQACASQ